MNERTCIVTRKAMDTRHLIRFVAGPDGVVVPDLKGRLPGRGVWVSCEGAAVKKAAETGLFARGFKAKCAAPKNLDEQVGRLLEKQALNLLSLARKAGEVITGFDKVHKAIGKGDIGLLLAAADGADDGRRKLAAKFAAVNDRGQIVTAFTSDQMNLALGGANVIHAAIRQGKMAQAVSDAANRLLQYRGASTRKSGAQALRQV